MRYISTRGGSDPKKFEDVVIAGLAPDGGLYVPEEYPIFSKKEIASMADLSYQDLVLRVIKPYIGDEIPDDVLKSLIDKSYSDFRRDDVAPLRKLAENEYVLELFHGPTLAFKDFALQLLGNLFDYVLKKRDQNVTIIGATSGDTGSAAIYGCMDCSRVKMFILHPHNRISDVQRKQMTSILADNVYNLAIEGDFDFCQDSTKAMFNDDAFLGDEANLVAINSINWCRIMAQIVYYFYAALKLGAPDKEVSFSVPTGNFGDIFAGYIAKKMGLPVKQLIIATNQNDILHRFISSGVYARGELNKSLSPSMDIQVASNFERLLFDLHDNDGAKIADLMDKFKTGSIEIGEKETKEAKEVFYSGRADDEETCNEISRIYQETGLLFDPHSAIGVKVGRETNIDKDTPIVYLATAHAAKFPEAVEKAGVQIAKLPEHLADLFDREERFDVLPADLDSIKTFIAENN